MPENGFPLFLSFGGSLFGHNPCTLNKAFYLAEKVALSLVLLGLTPRSSAALWGTTLYRYPMAFVPGFR
jgi:hypothetical protein